MIAPSVKHSKKLDIPEKTYSYQERAQEKRPELPLKISQTQPGNRVDIDESGMDNQEDYGYGWNQKEKRFYDLKGSVENFRERVDYVVKLTSKPILQLLYINIIQVLLVNQIKELLNVFC